MLNKLKNINWTKNMFLVPILLVAGISISHVVSWYDMANPYNWAIYLSIAIEIGAMTSLIAATKKIKGGVWFMFGLVTFIQMIGNIFYSYVQIDENGELFKNWIELTSPIFESMGTDPSDIIPHKRWLALLEGGLLPLISLTALHFYTKYDDTDDTSTLTHTPTSTPPTDNEPKPFIEDDGTELKTPWPTLEDYPKNEDGTTKTMDQLGKYDLKFGPEYTKVMNEVLDEIEEEEEVVEEEIKEPTPEIREIIEEVAPELIETIETPKSKEIKEELLPEVKSTQERLYPNTIEDDEKRRKVLSDENGKKTLTYKRNKINQKIEKR